MAEPTKPDRRRLLALAALLALVGLGGGAGLRLWRVSGGGAGLAGSSPFGSGLSPKAQALWSRLLAALEGSGRFTAARLIELLSRRQGDRAALAFAKDFQDDPELQGILDEYLHSQDSLSAAWLARRLGESPRFRGLVTRHADDPRFAALSGALADDVAAASSEGPAAGVLGAQPSERTGRPIGSPEPVASKTRVAEAAPPRAEAPLKAGAGPEGSADPSGSGEERKAATTATDGRKTTGEHEVIALAKLKTAGNSQAVNAWASLCYNHDPAITSAQCEAINTYLGDNALWAACEKAQLLDSTASKVGWMTQIPLQ